MFRRTRKSNGIPVSTGVHRLIRQADAARDIGDWATATVGYERVVEMSPSLGHIWIQLANCAAEAGRINQALDGYKRAAELRPTDKEPALFAARLYQRTGDLTAAARFYHQVQKIDGHGQAVEVAPTAPIILPARVAPRFHPQSKRERHPVLPAGMTIQELQVKLDACNFHHGIDFGHGLVSKAPADSSVIERTAEALFGSIDLHGRSFLDIGAWTGAYSFEAKERGARRVVASDHHVWNDPTFKGREAFDLALAITGLDIETQDIDVPDISPANMGTFDVVLFAGVFYHLLDAVHLTKQISRCADHLLILETHLDALNNPKPAMIFYPGGALSGDASNWWGPNPHCVYELLSEFGFTDIWYCDAPGDRGVFHAFRNVESGEAMGWSGGGGHKSLRDPAERAAIFAPTAAII